MTSTAEIFGFQNGGSGVFAELEDIDPNSGADSPPAFTVSCAFAPPNTVFGVSGFVVGMAVRSDVIYALELVGSDAKLITLTDTGNGCATGAAVSGSTVGFDNLESLVYVESEDVFYSVDFDEAPLTLVNW